MRNRLLLSLILLAAGPLAAAGAERELLNVIPRPAKMGIGEGTFTTSRRLPVKRRTRPSPTSS